MYSLRVNKYKEVKKDKKIIVPVEVELNIEMRQRLQAQVDYIQKALDTNILKTEKIEVRQITERVRDGETRTGKYKTLQAAKKAQKGGQHIDFFDGVDWHEDIKHELNGSKGSK